MVGLAGVRMRSWAAFRVMVQEELLRGRRTRHPASHSASLTDTFGFILNTSCHSCPFCRSCLLQTLLILCARCLLLFAQHTPWELLSRDHFPPTLHSPEQCLPLGLNPPPKSSNIWR